jgi:GT2 family glycosyltransferase
MVTLRAAESSSSAAVPAPAPDRPDISLCVPVWKRHSPPDLATLQASLPNALTGLRAELIVVLNGVSRSQVTLAPDAVVLEFETNRGVPVAWNRAAAAATADVLCFVNDDVVLGPSALRLLWESVSRDDAGVVGPVGTQWDIARGKHLAYVSNDGRAAGDLTPCDVVSGFLFATPVQVFRAVGGFDETYTPCGFEEVDYCTAVRLKLGLRCYAVAGVPHSHTFGISSRRQWRRICFDETTETIRSIARRNREHFLTKWAGLSRI